MLASLPEATASPVLWPSSQRNQLLKGSPTLPEAESREAALRSEWKSISADMATDPSAFPEGACQGSCQLFLLYSACCKLPPPPPISSDRCEICSSAPPSFNLLIRQSSACCSYLFMLLVQPSAPPSSSCWDDDVCAVCISLPSSPDSSEHGCACMQSGFGAERMPMKCVESGQ